MPRRIVLAPGVKSTYIDLAESYAESILGTAQTPSTTGLYSQIAFLYRCVDVRANALTSIPWAVLRGEDNEVYAAGMGDAPSMWPWLDDLRVLLWQSEAALTLCSTAYLHKLKSGSRIIGLRWLQPDTMKPQYNGDPAPISYTRRLPGKGTTQTLPAEDVAYLWLRGIDETTPRPAPAYAASIAAGVLYNTDQFVTAYFKRGAIKATLLGVPSDTPAQAKEEMKAWYNRVLSGIKNAWAAQVINADAITPIVIGSGIDELSNNTLTMEKREDIATALGVPHSLVLSNAANFATAEADRLNFYETTILPEAYLIAESLNRQLFQPLGLTFAWKPQEMAIYQEDEEQRATAFKTYVDAGILPSIVAQMLGLNLPEGVTPDMLDPIQPSTPFILPSTPAPPLQLLGPTAALEGDEYTDEVRKLRKWAKGKLAPDVTKFKSAILTDTDKCRALGLLQVGGSPSVPPFPTRKALLLLDPDDDEAESKVRRKLEKRSASEIAKALQDILDELERKGAQFEHAPHEMAKEFNELMKEMKQARKLRDPVERMLVDGVDLGVQTAVQQLANTGFHFDYSLVNVAARDKARQYAGVLVDQIDDTTLSVLREATARWIENGEPLQALIDDITPAFGSERAERIATTEVTKAFADANRDTYKESGVIDVMEWRTVEDEIVCHICGGLAGERAGVDDEFEFEGESYMPPAHPNCRCFVVPVVEWGR